MRARILILLAASSLSAALCGSRAFAENARLDYRGRVVPSREVEGLAHAALAAPRDSAALAAFLARTAERMQDEGYLDARVRAEWSEGGSPTLRVEIAEGTRYRIRSIAVSATAASDSAEILSGLGLRIGQWASPNAVRAAIDRTLHGAVDHGHPYAVLGVGGWDVDSSGVRLQLSGGLGPLVTISRVRIEGLRVTQPRVVEKSMGRLAGLPYSAAAADAARIRAQQLGLFRSVTLEGLEGEADWSRAQLVYRVEEPRYNRFEGAVGVQGDAGTVGLAGLDLDNLLGTGRAVGLRWESRGRGIAQLGARYAEPMVLGTPLRLEGTFDQQIQDTIFTRTQWSARGRLALSTQERIEAGFQQERVVQEKDVVQIAQIQSTVFALERSTLDEPLGPRRGTRVRIEASQSFKSEHLRPTGKRSARASAAELDGEWHHALSPRSGVTLEVQAAGRFSSERVLPFFERYPLGGASSLRGYDEEAFRVDRFALTRLEWRWFLGEGGQRVFAFWDHARAATRLPIESGGDRLDVIDRDGIGFGMRLEAAGGLVGLDYGLEPGRAPLEGKIHLRLITTF